jgi:hypothetical protein
MKSSDVAWLESAATIGLIAGLNKRLRDDRLDALSLFAMLFGGITGMIFDFLILQHISSQEPKNTSNAPEATSCCLDGGDLAAGTLLIVNSALASIAVRHVVPAAAKKVNALIFSKPANPITVVQQEDNALRNSAPLLASPPAP